MTCNEYPFSRSPQEKAQLSYRWRFAADRLMLYLTFGLNWHTDRLYRGDLRYLQAWLNEPDLPSTLATLFGNGHDSAKSLLQHHRDHLVDVGHTVGTVNRHLCTIRKAERIAREMGEIDWDLSDVANVTAGDNVYAGNGFETVKAGPMGYESPEPATTAPENIAAPGERK
jgi:hypothetical protein